MLLGVLIAGLITFLFAKNVNTVVEIFSVPNQINLCFEKIKIIGKTPISIKTPYPFINIYQMQMKNLINAMLNNHGKFYYLIEGASKQGKTIFGSNLLNQLINNPNVWCLYITLNKDDPKQIFQNMEECNWSVFGSAAAELQKINDLNQIFIIVDDIQTAFETKKIADGMFSLFKIMKNYQLNFLYISSQNSVTSKMELFIFLSTYLFEFFHVI